MRGEGTGDRRWAREGSFYVRRTGESRARLGAREGCFCFGRGEGPSLYRYRLLLGTAQVLPEPAVAMVDQLAVDVGAAGFDDRTDTLAVVGRAARDGQVDAGAFGQGGREIVVSFTQLVVGKPCSFSTSHGVGLAQLIGREIGHGTADGAEVEDSAGVLRELDSVEGGALDGAFDLVDGCVEAALVYLKG